MAEFVKTNSSGRNEAGLTYRPDIDGLRGVAILLVLAFHTFYLPAGFIGVDVFFVISGFLISNIIFRGLQDKNFSLREFYVRRINRIFPALIVILIFSLIAGWFFLLPQEYMSLGGYITAGAAFFSNIALYQKINYFDIFKDYKPLLHLWSLGIEEQFYLVIPFLLIVLWKWIRKPIVYIVAIFAISFALNIWLVGRSPTGDFYLPFTRFWELMIGIVLAYVSLFWAPPRPEQMLRKLAGWSGIVLLGLGVWLINEQRNFPGWWALLPTVGTALCVWAGQQSWVNRKIFSHPVLVFVGLISYPLYLWHWPLLSFARIFGISSPAASASIVALSFLLAWLTYRYVETPIRFGKNKPRKALWLLVAMVLVGFSGIAVYKKAGFPGRYDSSPIIKNNLEQLKGLQAHQDDNCQALAQSAVGQSDFDYCRFNNVHGKETVALIGDSHASAVFTGLSEELAKSGKNLLLLATGGCPTFQGVVAGANDADRTACAEKTPLILRLVQSRQDIKEVIIATRGEFYMTGENIIRRDIDLIPDNPEKVFSQALTETVSSLTKSGKQVFYILEVPGSAIEPRNCLRPRTQAECTVDMVEVLQTRSSFRNMISTQPNLSVIDPFPYLCSNGKCPAFDGDKLLYYDTHHLSPNGSRFLAPYIVKSLF